MAGKYPRFNDVLAVYAALARLGADQRAASLAEIQETAAAVAKTKVRVILSLLKEWEVVRYRRQRGYEVIRSGLGEAELTDLSRHYETRHERDREKLDRMIEFSQTAMCRWRKIVDYFGEQVDWETCQSCDNCLERLTRQPTALAG